MSIKSNVMTIANALVKQGVSRSKAMVRAWITVKLHAIQTKAAGVTHGNRQKLLGRFTRYKLDYITITLQRERDNSYDPNAVKIVAEVRNKGAAVIGYINRELAAALAPLLDKGATIASRFMEVTGGSEPYLNYGLNLELKV